MRAVCTIQSFLFNCIILLILSAVLLFSSAEALIYKPHHMNPKKGRLAAQVTVIIMLNINNETMCEYCFMKLQPGTKKCPHCPGQKNRKMYPSVLPVGTILAGKYSVGAVSYADKSCITYLCCDLNTTGRYYLREYFPKSCAKRNRGETIVNESGDAFKQGLELFCKEADENPCAVEMFYENNTAYYVIGDSHKLPIHKFIIPSGKSNVHKMLIAVITASALVLGGGIAAAFLLIGNRNKPSDKPSESNGIPENVATVSPENGILDVDPNEILNKDFSRIRLNMKEATLIEGDTVSLSAEIENVEKKDFNFEWTSDDEKIASVDENGVVTAVGKGTTKITVSMQKEKASCTVTVLRPVKSISLDHSEAVLRPMQTITLNAAIEPSDAYDQSVTWSSSDTNIVTVKDGKLTALKLGRAVITAKSNNGKTASCTVIVPGLQKISIQESELSLDTGISYTFDDITLSGVETDRLTDNEKKVTLTSSAPNIVEVNGISINAVNPGTATITLSLPNGISTTCKVTVKEVPIASIKLNKTAITLEQGASETLTAKILPENASDKDVTWLSSNEKVASVKNGIIQATAEGTAVITAKAGTASAECKVTVLSKDKIIASGTFGKNIEWTLDSNGTLNISGEGEMDVWEKNNTPWEAHKAAVKNVVISQNITNIGDYAFADCSNLLSIDIPNSVVSIGKCAFENCSKLSKIALPDSTASIGYWAFSNCSSLKNIVIPNSVTEIGAWSFYSCKNLTSVVLPEKLTVIETELFRGCESLSEIIIPNSVTCIEDKAFCYCKSLSDVTIPKSVVSIGSEAFYGCTSLTRVIIMNREGDVAIEDDSFINGTEILFTPDK